MLENDSEWKYKKINDSLYYILKEEKWGQVFGHVKSILPLDNDRILYYQKIGSTDTLWTENYSYCPYCNEGNKKLLCFYESYINGMVYNQAGITYPKRLNSNSKLKSIGMERQRYCAGEVNDYSSQLAFVLTDEGQIKNIRFVLDSNETYCPYNLIELMIALLDHKLEPVNINGKSVNALYIIDIEGRGVPNPDEEKYRREAFLKNWIIEIENKFYRCK